MKKTVSNNLKTKKPFEMRTRKENIRNRNEGKKENEIKTKQ